MFESLIVDVLNRYLGDYVKNLDSSQLKLGIWAGAVALNNLEVKENALSQLNVPFKVKAGHIGKLGLKIPWKSLYTQPVETVLDGVYLLIVPTASVTYDGEKEEKESLEAKQQQLKHIEEAKQKMDDQEKPKSVRQDTFVARLVTQVLKNLHVKISNIHVRYEDDIANPDSPLSFGVSLQNFSIQTSDNNWSPCFHEESSKLFYKLAQLDNLFAYWNVNSDIYYYRSSSQALEMLKRGVAAHNIVPVGYNCVFRPVSGKAKLRMNPHSDFDFSSPKIVLDVNLEDIAVEFNKPQYRSVMELLESINMMSKNLPYRKFRPECCVHNNARTWWKYAITGIVEVNVKPGLHMWSWKHIQKHREMAKQYKVLYKAKITSRTPAAYVLNMNAEYEKSLDIFNITLARQQAEVEARKSRLKIYKPGVKDVESQGWFGWFRSWFSKRPTKNAESLEEMMTRKEKAQLYAAIGISEGAIDPTVPKSYEAVSICVKLPSMSFQLREAKGKTLLLSLTITDLCTVLKQRPGAQAIRFEAQVGALKATGTPQGTAVPCLLTPEDSSVSLLSLVFETNPLDELADQRLQVESLPLQIIYDAKTINSLADFFRPPEDAHLEHLTSATLAKLEEFRDKTSTGLLYIIETQKVLDVNINLASSCILAPQNGFYNLESNLLILDLGSLRMKSRGRINLPQLNVGQSTIEDIMSQAYESFDVQLSSVQLLYSKHCEDWKEALRQKHSPQHILQPVDLNVTFSRAMVVTDPRMPKFKLFGQLPLLCVRISDRKLKCVLELIDSIPKPENPYTPSSVRISEEVFYDAPTSPMEPVPMESKRLTQQKALKNMTDFHMAFDIPKAMLQMCRLSEDSEENVLNLEVLGLGTELNVRTFDMTANASLKEIALQCPQYIDEEAKTVYLLTTMDNATDDVLTLKYVKAGIDGPEFATTHKSVEQLLKANFSSLDVHLHPEALLSTVGYLKALLPTSEVQKAEPLAQEAEDKKEKQNTTVALDRASRDDIVNLHVCAVLTSLRVFIREGKHSLSEINIEGLDSQVIMTEKATDILAKLKNIVIKDLDRAARYKEVVCITGNEVFSLKATFYVEATQGAAYTDMSVVDSRIALSVGWMQVIFVNRFVSAILDFVNISQKALVEATVQAAEKAVIGVKELAQRSYRLALDVNFKVPVVILPQSYTSSNVLVADFGLITVKNQFFIITPNSHCSLPPVIDSMTVKLSELNLYRTVFESDALRPSKILQPLNLDIVVERSLAAAWYSDIHDVKITGHLEPMSLILDQEDLTMILRTLNDHFGETSQTISSVQKIPSRETTVVTAAVVETNTSAEVKTTLKLDFQLECVALSLYNFDTKANQMHVRHRDDALELAEFRLGLTSTAVEMTSDGRMSAALKITNCTLDDKRDNVQKASSRMLEMTHSVGENVMVDVAYRQGRGVTILDAIICDIYLCASMEFLFTIADVFLQASEQAGAAHRSIKQTASASKETACTQQVSRMEMSILVKNPEIVFVADLTKADAPALVLTTQFELSIHSSAEAYHMTASLKDLRMEGCPFLPDMRAGNITSIIQPCDVFFQSLQFDSGPPTMRLSLKSLMLKVSPVILNTVTTIISAVFPSKEATTEVTSPVPGDLWKKEDVEDLKLWFLEEAMERKNVTGKKDKLVLTGETLKFNIESIIVTLEAGIGQRTIPILLAKSSFSGNVKDWSTLINLYSQLALEVHYFNDVFGVWEPLLEPLEVDKSDAFRLWTLGITMKKRPRKQPRKEQYYKIPEYVTETNIFSKDHLNITLSKCGLQTLCNLGQAFVESTSKAAYVCKEDQAPFVVKNALGLKVFVSPSDFFTPLNVELATKYVALNDGENLGMDYIQRDKFSAMTSLSSNQFYIELIPLQHSTTDKIPLTKVGRSLHSVWHSDTGSETYLVCQIDTVGTSKRITIRSPLQIRNHFSLAFDIYEDGVCLGTAEPEEDFNIPLSSYRSTLCLKPGQGEAYRMCEGISFVDIFESDGNLLERKCQSLRSKKNCLVINVVAVKDVLISSGRTYDKWDLPHVVHLWPPVLLRNLLPYQITYCLEGRSNPVLIDEGCSAQIHNAAIDQTMLNLQLLNYLGKNWQGRYHIQSKKPEIHYIKLYSDAVCGKAELDIAVYIQYSTGQTIIAIHSPYWMVNKTRRILYYKADGAQEKHPAALKKPLLFSFKPKHFFQNNKAQLMMTNSELSDSFSLDTVGTYGAVKCKAKHQDYHVGVTIQASSFNLTRIATFTPFFMITNKSKYQLHLMEEGVEKWITVESEQCIPFWPVNSDSRLAVKVEDSRAPSKKIHFNKQNNNILLRLDGKYGAILADVTLREHSTVISFSDYHKGAAPFLLINHTKSESIKFYQSSVKGKANILPPGKAMLYAWADPSSPRELSWICGKNTGEILQTTDIVRSLKVKNSVVYLVSFLEGLQRIVLFTEERNVFEVTYDNEKAEIAEQEVTLSLSNIGISLVNNYSNQEVSYIGIASSDAVWECQKKSRWRPLSVKHSEKLEEAYKEYKSAPTGNRIVMLDEENRVCLTPSLTGMKFVGKRSAPVRRSFLPAMKVEYSSSAHQTSIRAKVYSVQVQNQIPGAIFPFVFYPVKPPKSVTLDMEPKPFADVSIVMRTAGHSDLTRIKYFKVLIQEMDLHLDLGFLYALADFAMQSGDISKHQELELFKKDMESLQAALSTVSSLDTSLISLYEYFHVSPIKLHLSFTLGDGRKEQPDKKLFPVQSLNLMLMSIGASLTDVQDVVFHLPFFHLHNQFYTRTDLQWDVIRHYLKQALKQLYVLVLGLSVLGNPFGFLRGLSRGVESFFYEPYQGAIEGPEEFVEGMALGVRALVGGAIGGLAGAASRITGAVAKGLTAITMDEEYQQKRRNAMKEQPRGIKDGVTRGGRCLVSGFFGGVTGIVTKPVEGAKQEGAAGFLKGVGKGLVGAVARPVGGVVDMFSSTFQGIKRSTESSADVQSLRPPRFLHEDGIIRPYRMREGVGSQLLQEIENGRFSQHKYLAHTMVNNTDFIMLTKSGVLYVTKGPFGQLTSEWQCSFDDFTKLPYIVGGRRLRIEATEQARSVFHSKENGKIINFKTPEDAQWILSKIKAFRNITPKT